MLMRCDPLGNGCFYSRRNTYVGVGLLCLLRRGLAFERFGNWASVYGKAYIPYLIQHCYKHLAEA